MELGSVTLKKRIGFFWFPIKHSTHIPVRSKKMDNCGDTMELCRGDKMTLCCVSTMELTPRRCGIFYPSRDTLKNKQLIVSSFPLLSFPGVIVTLKKTQKTREKGRRGRGKAKKERQVAVFVRENVQCVSFPSSHTEQVTGSGNNYLGRCVLCDFVSDPLTVSWYFLKRGNCRGSCLCLFTAVPNTKLCVWGEEDSGGHVL